MRCTFLLVSYLLLSSVALAQTPGQFEVRYDISALTAAQQTQIQPSLDAAANVWESLIIGYQPGITLDGIDLDVSALMIDGSGTVLAQAGISGSFWTLGGFTFATDGSFPMMTNPTSSTGFIQLDVDDFSTPLIVDVLVHEIGHALGFGSLFDIGANNNLGAADEYTGSEGLAAYQAEFDPTATFIPLTSDSGHYLENNFLTDASGRIFSRELMTPIVTNTTNANDPGSNYLSETTLGVFRDLGYQTVTVATIPEPSAFALLSLGLLSLCGQRRRSMV